MKVVILAGGYGTRLAEESVVRPKPMVEIGGYPILWHIMKIYSAYGLNDFIICLGYKGYAVKEYFNNYFLHMSDVTFDMERNKMEVHRRYAEPWHVTLIDTGEGTQTGGRLKRVQPYIGDDDFCMTYGDGVADIRLPDLLAFHKKEGTLATVTAVQQPGRWGSLVFRGDRVADFIEKPPGDGVWVNGGFFVLSPKVLDYIEGDHTGWESGPLRRLAAEQQLAAYRHHGFWQAMDTLRDRNYLDRLWATGQVPWKVW